MVGGGQQPSSDRVSQSILHHRHEQTRSMLSERGPDVGEDELTAVELITYARGLLGKDMDGWVVSWSHADQPMIICLSI